MSSVVNRLQEFLGKSPQIDATAYVHPTAILLGDVRVGAFATILPYAVLRADINYIEVGAYTNIQDGCIVHLSDDFPVRLGPRVTVGHGAVLHACTVEEGSLIGIRSTLLDGSVIGAGSVVGAHALVTKNERFPSRSMILGTPGKRVREVTEAESSAILSLAEKYVQVGAALRAA